MAERRFNEELGRELERTSPSLEVFVPQRCDGLFMGVPDFSQKIFACLMDAINNCDCVIAILDGSDADSGTCIEMGYAYAKGKRIIGVRTDFRAGQEHGVNLMAANICEHLLVECSTTGTCNRIAERIAELLLSESL